MKKLIGICLFVLIGFVFSKIFAQQDPAAKSILDQLAAKTKSYTTIKTDFVYTYEDKKDGTSLTKEGDITMKGEMYKLNFMESVIFSDGKTIWSYSPEFNEVNVAEATTGENETSVLENPQRLLYIYNDEYKYSLIKEYPQNNKKYAEIDLYPNSLNEAYSRITIIINKSDFQLVSANVFGKNGENHLFYFNNLQFNIGADDSFFIFNKANYPGVEVIDLRL